MSDNWEKFLSKNTNHDGLDFTKSPIISPLSDFCLIAISGDDRHDFLHGQFINDLNLINNTAAQLSAWCNPKGQVITNLIIVNTGISYLLIFKQELKEYVLKRLTMFVLRADVKIEDISKPSPIIGIANLNDLSVISDKTPKHAGDTIASDGLVIISHPDNSGRYLITGTIDTLINKLSELNLKFNDNSAWDFFDIKAGLPWITSATQEQFLPQMLNLDALKGLSYQKGCYPGQEVIARLHYRGEVKKRLQLITSLSELTVGSEINSKGNKVGSIVNSINFVDKINYGLAVVELNALQNELYIDNNKLQFVELPYPIDT